MTREAHPDGKVLIIGGGIANFTNVATTFKGVIRALEAYVKPAAQHARILLTAPTMLRSKAFIHPTLNPTWRQ